MTTIREAPAGEESAFSATIEGVMRSALRTAGWKSEEGAGGTIWRNPADRHWYDELRALAILKVGADPGGSD